MSRGELRARRTVFLLVAVVLFGQVGQASPVCAALWSAGSGLARCASPVASRLLEASTPVLSIADAATDVIITKQYWDNAHEEGVFPMFFSLSLGILIVSQISSVLVYLLTYTEETIGRNRQNKVLEKFGLNEGPLACFARVLMLLAVVLGLFLVSPLIPVIVWWRTRNEQLTRPTVKTPFKGIVRARRAKLRAHGQAVFEYEGEEKVAGHELWPGELDVLGIMPCDKRPVNDLTFEKKKLLMFGNWATRQRNFHNDERGHYLLKFDEEGVLKCISDAGTERFSWDESREAWAAPSQTDGFWVLLRMIDPNVLAYEVELPIAGHSNTITSHFLLRYAQPSFEPQRDAKQTNAKFTEWSRSLRKHYVVDGRECSLIYGPDSDGDYKVRFFDGDGEISGYLKWDRIEMTERLLIYVKRESYDDFIGIEVACHDMKTLKIMEVAGSSIPAMWNIKGGSVITAVNGISGDFSVLFDAIDAASAELVLECYSSDGECAIKETLVKQEVDLLVWLGSVDPPRPPQRPQFATLEAQDIQEWQDSLKSFYFVEQFPYFQENARHASEKLSEKFHMHIPFIVEASTESTPQALLQTTAVVIYSQRNSGHVTYAQFVSIGLSLAALMTKVPTLCKSLVPEATYWKAACICYDVATLFYTFTALWSVRRGDPEGWHVFFISRPVDALSAIYVYSLFAEVSAILVWIIVYLVGDDRGSEGCVSWKDRRSCLLSLGTIFLCVCIITLPVTFLIVFMRLSLFVLLLFLREATLEKHESFNIKAYKFTCEGDDFGARLKAVNHIVRGVSDDSRVDVVSLGLADINFSNMISELDNDPSRSRCYVRLYQGSVVFVIIVFTLTTFFSVVIYPYGTFATLLWKHFVHDHDMNPFREFLFVTSIMWLLAVICTTIYARKFLMYSFLVEFGDVSDEVKQLAAINDTYNNLYKSDGSSPAATPSAAYHELPIEQESGGQSSAGRRRRRFLRCLPCAGRGQ